MPDVVRVRILTDEEREQESWFGERLDPEFAQKNGRLEALRRSPPEGSVLLDIDEMGPVAVKSYSGQQAVTVSALPAQRAKQEIDDGRRGNGYFFGAFRPATGEAYMHDYPGRTIANWIDFLERVDRWLPSAGERVYAILDNLSAQHADDVLLFCLTHPRREFVFRPLRAAYLSLIEPRWKVVRSLAFKGRRFETWEEAAAAVREATT